MLKQRTSASPNVARFIALSLQLKHTSRELSETTLRILDRRIPMHKCSTFIECLSVLEQPGQLAMNSSNYPLILRTKSVDVILITCPVLNIYSAKLF